MTKNTDSEKFAGHKYSRLFLPANFYDYITSGRKLESTLILQHHNLIRKH